MSRRAPNYRIRKAPDGRWEVSRREGLVLQFFGAREWRSMSFRPTWEKAMKLVASLDYYDRLGGVSHRKAERR